MNFTSVNNDTITELKSFYLTNIDASKFDDIRTQSFLNVKCKSPNNFILKGVKPGLYIGFMHIENKKGNYDITIDSILIKKGENHLTKEINLGSAKL